MISSRVQTALPAQVMNSPAKPPKTPAILTNALGSRMMSMISSDLSAAMNSAGICRTKPIRPASAPWNQAQARGIALAFLMFSQISSWPMSFMKPPIRVFGVRGTGSPVTGSSPEHRLEQVVAARAFGQLRPAAAGWPRG